MEALLFPLEYRTFNLGVLDNNEDINTILRLHFQCIIFFSSALRLSVSLTLNIHKKNYFVFIFISFCVLDVITLIRRDEICVGEKKWKKKFFYHSLFTWIYDMCHEEKIFVKGNCLCEILTEWTYVHTYIIILDNMKKKIETSGTLFFWWIFYDLVWMWKLLWMWNCEALKNSEFFFIFIHSDGTFYVMSFFLMCKMNWQYSFFIGAVTVHYRSWATYLSTWSVEFWLMEILEGELCKFGYCVNIIWIVPTGLRAVA